MHTTQGDLIWHTFRAGTPMHAAALATVAMGCGVAVTAGRLARRHGVTTARRVDLMVASLAMGCWLGLLVYFTMPVRFGWGQSLPLHVCHVVGLAAPLALWGRSRVARAVLYFWGLGLTTQSMVTPIVTVGLAHGTFWVYWVWHGVLVGAAAYDLGARRYRPGWRDWQLAVAMALAYGPIAFLVNCVLGTDYGWLGQGRMTRWTMLSAFGTWPTRVPWMILAGCGVMTLLAIVWPRNWRRPALAVARVARFAMPSRPECSAGSAA